MTPFLVAVAAEAFKIPNHDANITALSGGLSDFDKGNAGVHNLIQMAASSVDYQFA